MIEHDAIRSASTYRPVWLLGTLLLVASPMIARADGAATAIPQGAAHAVADATERPTPSASAGTKGARPAVKPAKGLPEDDYYAKRAKSLLVEDAADAAKLVSLEAAYPGHNVVMCEAGCYGSAKRIVQFAPKLGADRETAGRLEPTAAELPAEPVGSRAPATAAVAPPPPEDAVSCVAGCYNAPTSYRGVSTADTAAAVRAEAEALIGARPAPKAEQSRAKSGATGPEANRWITTSTRAADTSGHAAKNSDRPAKHRNRSMMANGQRSRTNPSGEWFQTINSDRMSRAR